MLRLSSIGIVVFILFSSNLAETSICLRLSFDALVEQSDWVVVAHMDEDGISAWGPKRLRIYTAYRFRVTEQVAGVGQDVFTVVQPGGRVGRWSQLVRGYPKFRKDMPVMLFLKKKDSSYQVVGLSQGVFSFGKDEHGQEVLHQQIEGLSLVSAEDRLPSYGQSMVLTPASAKRKIKELWRAKEAS